MTTINKISITGSSLNIEYKGGAPSPSGFCSQYSDGMCGGFKSCDLQNGPYDYNINFTKGYSTITTYDGNTASACEASLKNTCENDDKYIMNSQLKYYWENRSKDWLISRNNVEYTENPIIEYIHKNIDTDNTILEIGVGTGRYLHYFKKYKKLYGIDFISEFIDNCNKIKPNNCELFVDDTVSLKFNKKVDLVYSIVSLQHIHSSQIDVSIKNIVNLNPKDIILWELFTDNKDNSYTFSHDYKKIFKNTNYKLVYIYKHTNNITYLYHFKNNDF